MRPNACFYVQSVFVLVFVFFFFGLISMCTHCSQAILFILKRVSQVVVQIYRRQKLYLEIDNGPAPYYTIGNAKIFRICVFINCVYTVCEGKTRFFLFFLFWFFVIMRYLKNWMRNENQVLVKRLYNTQLEKYMGESCYSMTLFGLF